MLSVVVVTARRTAAADGEGCLLCRGSHHRESAVCATASKPWEHPDRIQPSLWWCFSLSCSITHQHAQVPLVCSYSPAYRWAAEVAHTIAFTILFLKKETELHKVAWHLLPSLYSLASKSNSEHCSQHSQLYGQPWSNEHELGNICGLFSPFNCKLKPTGERAEAITTISLSTCCCHI